MTQASALGDKLSAPFPFRDQIVVFTGKLASIGRREAYAVIERQGGLACDQVTSRTTILVIGAGVAGVARGQSNKLRKAEVVNTRSPGSIQILSEDEFCRLAALQSSELLYQLYHSLSQIRSRYPRIREAQLRYLEKCGLLQPVARTQTDTYYSFSDVSVLKKIHDELEQNGSFHGAVRRRLAAREGQLALNFSAARGAVPAAKVVALRRREATKVTISLPSVPEQGGEKVALAARFFLEGSELDEGSEQDRERALIAYRKALLLDPTLVPAIVNLANLHYAHDDLVEAQALYSRALLLDSSCFEAHFNLGNIHHDLGRLQEAMTYYDGALQLNPKYADGHFYVAVTLEKMGRSEEAKEHWRLYQELAPNGEWFDLAKEFSE